MVLASCRKTRHDQLSQSHDCWFHMKKWVSEGSVAAGLAAGLTGYAETRGADRARLLSCAGLAEADCTDPDARIPLPTYLALIRSACRLTNDPALALRWGAEVGMADLSIVGLIMEASATMGEAFLQLQRYDRLALSAGRPIGAAPRFDGLSTKVITER